VLFGAWQLLDVQDTFNDPALIMVCVQVLLCSCLQRSARVFYYYASLIMHLYPTSTRMYHCLVGLCYMSCVYVCCDGLGFVCMYVCVCMCVCVCGVWVDCVLTSTRYKLFNQRRTQAPAGPVPKIFPHLSDTSPV
jgi:hypothetical protein